MTLNNETLAIAIPAMADAKESGSDAMNGIGKGATP